MELVRTFAPTKPFGWIIPVEFVRALATGHGAAALWRLQSTGPVAPECQVFVRAGRYWAEVRYLNPPHGKFGILIPLRVTP